jgi:integrase
MGKLGKGWLKRPGGSNCTLFVWRDSTGAFRSRTLGPGTMTDTCAWQKVGEEGYHLLVGKALPDAISFGDLRRAFILDAHTVSGRPKAHSTVNTEKRNCRLHLSHFDRTPAKDITSRMIKDWLRRQSTGLQSKLRNTLSSVYRFGRVEGMVPSDCDPVKDVGASSLSSYEAVPVSPEQAFAILDQIESPLVRCLVILLSVTGLRPSEALALRWNDLNFENGTIKIERGFVDGQIGDPKSIASRGTVEMHEALAAVMQAWRKETMYAAADDFVFASERKNGKQPRLGSMLSVDYVRPTAIRAGVIDASCPRFGLHNMRHGLATFLAEAGTDLRVIQRMLRWSSTRMLQRYLHPKKQARKAQGVFLGRMKKKGHVRVQVRVQQKRPAKRRGA